MNTKTHIFASPRYMNMRRIEPSHCLNYPDAKCCRASKANDVGNVNFGRYTMI